MNTVVEQQRSAKKKETKIQFGRREKVIRLSAARNAGNFVRNVFVLFVENVLRVSRG